MGIDPETQKRNEELQAEMRRREAERMAEQKKQADKAKILSTNKKNLKVAQRSGKVNIVVAKRGGDKVTVLIGNGHDPQLIKKIEANGINGHIDVTDHGLVVTQNVRGPAFEAAMKQITPAKISYKS
jgi:23S rRNA pseudoU1915 N3-methylase RlmH